MLYEVITFLKITEDPEVQTMFTKAGASLEGVVADPAVLKEKTEDDYATYGKLIDELGLAKK